MKSQKNIELLILLNYKTELQESQTMIILKEVIGTSMALPVRWAAEHIQLKLQLGTNDEHQLLIIMS